MSTNQIIELDNLGKYRDIILQHLISAAIGFTLEAILPGADTVGVAASWITLMLSIVRVLGNSTDDAIVQKFAEIDPIGATILQGIFILTGIGVLDVVTINTVLNFLNIDRLGIFIAERYERLEFSREHAMSVLDSATKIILAIPTTEELKFAFIMHQNK